jgi:ATP-binding protein involved in chromosome partitioning
LGKVNDPEIGRDLVSLGMVRDIDIEGGAVSFTIVLTTPACPLKGQIESDATDALMALDGVDSVTVEWDAQVPRDDRLSQEIEIGVRNAVAVGSGKGGVGKSTVAVNLAASLVQQGATVGLLDADVYGPNIPMMMGVSDARPVSRDGKRIEPIEAHGVKLMSIGFLIDESQPVVWRGPMLHQAIRQFLSDVVWGDLDYLIIDLPPGTGDVQLSLSQFLPLTGAVVVTTPQAVSMADVLKAVSMFQMEQINVPVLGVVENMSGFVAPDTGTMYDIFGSGGGKRISEKMNVPYLGEVPIDPLVRISGDGGTPLVMSHPDSPAAEALSRISRELAAQVSLATLNRPPAREPRADPDLRIVD